MKHLLIILLFGLMFFEQSCKKEKPNSENSVTCKINGVLFTNSKTISLLRPSIHIKNTPAEGFYLFAYHFGDKDDPYDKYIGITLNFVTKVGAFQLDDLPKRATYYLQDTTSSFYTTDKNHLGEINFTVTDTVNHHYEGTFSFNAFNQQPGKTVSITDGYFNLTDN